MRLRIGSTRLAQAIVGAEVWLRARLPRGWLPWLNMSIMTGYGMAPHLYEGKRRNVDVYFLLWTGPEPFDTPDDLCVPLPGEFAQPLEGWSYPVQLEGEVSS